MKGIVLAGGSGSRLHPITKGVSKQLLPIYDKPMVYYPISVLMMAGIRDILVISTPDDVNNYERLLNDGEQFGLSIKYSIQDKPGGIAQAFLVGRKFIGKSSVCLVLGDNVFYGQGFGEMLSRMKDHDEGAVIFGYKVADPSSFGVVEFDDNYVVKSLEEKPISPKSYYAIPGLYFYDNQVVDIATRIEPSERGELEITSVNQAYLEKSKLKVQVLGRGFAWLDTGTNTSLLQAAQFIETIQSRQGLFVACLEEIALNNNWIDEHSLRKTIRDMGESEYSRYLKQLLPDDASV